MNEYHIFKLAFDRGIVMKSGYKSPDGRTDIKTERREKRYFSHLCVIRSASDCLQ